MQVLNSKEWLCEDKDSDSFFPLKNTHLKSDKSVIIAGNENQKWWLS